MRKPWWQLLVALMLFIFPLAGIVQHGKGAVSGIMWGYELEVLRLCRALPLVCTREQVTSAVNFGVYDPTTHFAGPMAIEHMFIPWHSYTSASMLPDLQRAASRNRWPLITVEPWPYEASGVQSLFSDIIRGMYDDTIGAICSDIQAFAQPVFVRWGHEMERVTGRYPWAQADSTGYIEAYRHFVDVCRAQATNIFYVWSPVGNKELSDYWPGEKEIEGQEYVQYADYVGLSVYGFPEWDMTHHRQVRSFEQIFAEKYNRIKGFKRPVMIAELGVTGSRTHQARWLSDALLSFRKYPLLKSVVYFNAIDHREAWPEPFRVPDWRVDLSIFPQ